MKRAAIALFCILFLGNVFGQDYHKLIREGCDWDIHFALGSEICMLSGGVRLYFEGDTSVNGIDYKITKFYPIISLIPIPYCPPFAIDTTAGGVYWAFMREDTISKQVYVYDHWNNEEDLLYDFSLIVGDTLHSQYAGQGSILVVDSVSTIMLLNGESRGIWYLNSGEYYIEGIGGSQGLCFPLIEGIGFWNIPLCITDKGEHLWGSECFGLVGIGELIQEKQTLAYPNPFTTSTTIEYELTEPSHVQLTIYNHLGEEVEEAVSAYLSPGVHTYEWRPQRLPGGVYFAVLKSEDGVSAIKTIKQRKR